MSKEVRDSLLEKGLEVLQSDAINDHCIAVLCGPDFCTLISGDSRSELFERLHPLVYEDRFPECKYRQDESLESLYCYLRDDEVTPEDCAECRECGAQ